MVVSSILANRLLPSFKLS